MLENVAKMGFFSSDRTIETYCDEIWDVKPIKVGGLNWCFQNNKIIYQKQPYFLNSYYAFNIFYSLAFNSISFLARRSYFYYNVST